MGHLTVSRIPGRMEGYSVSHNSGCKYSPQKMESRLTRRALRGAFVGQVPWQGGTLHGGCLALPKTL